MPWPSIWPFSSSSPSDSTNSNTSKKQQEQQPSILSAFSSLSSSTENANPSPVSAALDTNLFSRLSKAPLESTLLILTISITSILAYRGQQSYLSHLSTASRIPPSFYTKRRTISGLCTSVGDGDNFRLYHSPGGRLAGYFWLSGRRIKVDRDSNSASIDASWWRFGQGRKKLKGDETIHVRLAGVDAPELGHWGNEAQPGAKEALDWLRGYVSGRRVRVRLLKPDQYGRVVGTVLVRKLPFGFRKDVSLEMLKQGLACVYEAKGGAEFGGREPQYRDAEARAKMAKKGMWETSKRKFESPRDYKTRISSHGQEKDDKEKEKEVKARSSSTVGNASRSIWSVFFGKK